MVNTEEKYDGDFEEKQISFKLSFWQIQNNCFNLLIWKCILRA